MAFQSRLSYAYAIDRVMQYHVETNENPEMDVCFNVVKLTTRYIQVGNAPGMPRFYYAPEVTGSCTPHPVKIGLHHDQEAAEQRERQALAEAGVPNALCEVIISELGGDYELFIHEKVPMTIHVRLHLTTRQLVEIDEAEVLSLETLEVKVKPNPADRLERIILNRESETECIICMEEITSGSQAIRMPCKHVYHEFCLVKWLTKSRSCPLCRYELPPEDLAA